MWPELVSQRCIIHSVKLHSLLEPWLCYVLTLDCVFFGVNIPYILIVGPLYKTLSYQSAEV